MPINLVRELREDTGMSQAQLAVAAGVSITTLSKLENVAVHYEMWPFSIGVLTQIAGALKKSPTDLYPRLDKP